jgi:hypothetical protein
VLSANENVFSAAMVFTRSANTYFWIKASIACTSGYRSALSFNI